MPDPFIGQIMPVGFGFAARGWATCDGQIMAISQNQALFSLLGTTFGGDGRSTFALPDLRGRVAVHVGNGPGLSNYSWGQKGGSETVTLNTNQMPSHNHTVNCTSTAGNVSSPVGAIPGSEIAQGADVWQSGSANNTMRSDMIGNTGGGQPHNNLQPYLAIFWLIALTGVFPSRN